MIFWLIRPKPLDSDNNLSQEKVTVGKCSAARWVDGRGELGKWHRRMNLKLHELHSKLALF